MANNLNHSRGFNNHTGIQSSWPTAPFLKMRYLAEKKQKENINVTKTFMEQKIFDSTTYYCALLDARQSKKIT